jgi:hypothetical protein
MRNVRNTAFVVLCALWAASLVAAQGVPPEDGTMVVSPKVLYLEYLGSTVTIHTEIAYGSVDRSTLELYGVGDDPVTPSYTKSDARGNLVVKFEFADVRTIVCAPATTLTLIGFYADGGVFSLYDSIVVLE